MKYPQLSKVFNRMKAGDRLNVVFFGGSITWGATATDPLKTSYRALLSSWLEQKFPKAHIKSIDAAIGGTGSKLGVFRMDRDVLPYKPDLIFVEFAVNDGEAPETKETMEGIIRKLHASNPETAIVILVIGSGNKYSALPTWKIHRELAASYGLPCIDIVTPVLKRVKDGLKTSEFLTDGCHPNDKGYRIYADIIIANIAKLAVEKGSPIPFPKKALTGNRFESARMIELSKLSDIGGWKPALPSIIGTWFDHQPSRWHSSAVTPAKAGASLKVQLECSGIGLYFELTRNGGPIILKADGKHVLQIKTAMDFHYERVGWVFSCLEESKKREIEIIANKPEKTKASYLLVTK